MEKNNPGKQSQIRGLLFKEIDPIIDAETKDSIEQFRKIHSIRVNITQLIYQKLIQLEKDEKLIA